MFELREVKEVKTVRVVNAKYSRAKLEQLIKQDAEADKIKVTRIEWLPNGSALVSGKPLTQAKMKELEKALELSQPGKEGK